MRIEINADRYWNALSNPSLDIRNAFYARVMKGMNESWKGEDALADVDITYQQSTPLPVDSNLILDFTKAHGKYEVLARLSTQRSILNTDMWHQFAKDRLGENFWIPFGQTGGTYNLDGQNVIMSSFVNDTNYIRMGSNGAIERLFENREDFENDMVLLSDFLTHISEVNLDYERWANPQRAERYESPNLTITI